MAALRTLISGEIPPVGQRVRWRREAPRNPPPVFPGYRALWTNSGTAALAHALRVARMQRPDVDAPEVLIPAYGCPDLVAAAQYAGIHPVLVDVGPHDPGMNAGALDARWGPRVIACVAVNFLGIRERIDSLRARARDSGAWLIEDCAQWYPEAVLEADAVVVSFGRGKPVNVLGGGGLLLREDLALPRELERMPDGESGMAVGTQAVLFNLLLHPHPYALAARMPGLALGETRFRPLQSVTAIDDARYWMLAGNVRSWLERDRWREDRLNQALANVQGIHALPLTLRSRAGRLLRYPILLPSRTARDGALAMLSVRGMGASAFYRTPLTRVAGVPESVRAQPVAADTESFADRLLTLPLHDGVRASDLARMVRILKRSRRRYPESQPLPTPARSPSGAER
jgi:dTDP-4-amino-4,6-dideoxygalactose transaminase